MSYEYKSTELNSMTSHDAMIYLNQKSMYGDKSWELVSFTRCTYRQGHQGSTWLAIFKRKRTFWLWLKKEMKLFGAITDTKGEL